MLPTCIQRFVQYHYGTKDQPRYAGRYCDFVKGLSLISPSAHRKIIGTI